MESLFTPKEISWLSFNARVLQEAADSTAVPLLERIKFLGIFSSNLDEFFRVRVATLKRLAQMGRGAKKLIGHDPNTVLKKIQKIVLELYEEFDKTYQDILKDLAKEGIFIIGEQQLTPRQGEFVKSYFHSEVYPRLMPIMLDQVENFPDLKDESIYLAVCLSKSDSTKKRKYALIEVPTSVLPRFLILPQQGKKRFVILLDDAIRYGLVDIFSVFHFDQFEAYTVKLTRDAELDIEDDISQSYIRKVSKSLQKRKEGSPVRFVYDSKMPKRLLNVFIRELGLDEEDALIAGGRYHNFKDFMRFPDFDLANGRYEPITPLLHKHFHQNESLLETISQRDLLVHYPYQSFDYVIGLLREASIDPKVMSIKIAIYRAAKNSSVINALINAAKNGKKVIAMLELQARFDEAANIYFANMLQEEGVRVVFGVPGLKVHSKLCLITRKKKGRIFQCAIIGTGNYNEDTARTYSDHSLFTADKRLTDEVSKVFDFFENNYKTTTFKHLIVSPFQMRKKLAKLIRNEIKNAQMGKDAYIILKANNLVDFKITNLLYQASSAGVKTRLIVRSMFSLIPGISGVSDNIEAVSIVDKFLEHSRIFVFCNGGEEKYFISSADVMPRNIDNRVEVTCPIYDKDIQRELRSFLEIQWADNVKARILNREQDNQFREDNSSRSIRSQCEIYDFLKNGIWEEAEKAS